MIIIPFFNSNLTPSQLLCFLKVEDDGNSELINIGFSRNSPFHSIRKISLGEFKDTYLCNSDNVFFRCKELYKLFGLEWDLNDGNSALWSNDIDPIHVDLDSEVFDIPTYVRQYSNLYFKEYFDGIINHRTNENLQTVIKASSLLDGYILYDDEKKYKYFDHYTKGGRFRDTLSNSINIEAKNRGKLASKGVRVYVDIDSFHLRLLDQNLGLNMIPKDVRGHDWVIEKAFGNRPPKDVKKKIFQALYSENFYMVPCDFMDFVGMRYKKMKSAFGRPNRTFNDKVQEHDVLEMSKIILGMHNEGFSDILLYLYDGLLFDVPLKKLELFLETAQRIIKFPYKVNINDKELRFNGINDKE